jgi:hypothetical protein
MKKIRHRNSFPKIISIIVSKTFIIHCSAGMIRASKSSRIKMGCI